MVATIFPLLGIISKWQMKNKLGTCLQVQNLFISTVFILPNTLGEVGEHALVEGKGYYI